MVMKTTTYGRKPARQTKLAAECFMSSSSPVQPDEKRNTTRDADSPVNKERNLEVDLIAEDLKHLEITGEENINPGTPAASKRRRKTAAPRSANRNPLSPRDQNLQSLISSAKPEIKDSISPLTPNARRAAAIRERGCSTPNTPNVTTRSVAASASKLSQAVLPTPTPTSSSSPAQRRRQRRTERLTRTPVTQLPSALSEATSCSPTLISHVGPLLQLCTDLANRHAPVAFDSWSKSLASYFNITKLAEASYGEVYRLSLLNNDSKISKTAESVLKIIALKPPKSFQPRMTAAQRSRIADMSDVAAVASEVRLLRHMSPVPGFTRFRDARVVRGRLPAEFVTAWKSYDRDVKKSFFPDPGRKGTYSEDQLWAVVEMEDAGKDLEHIVVRDVWGAWDAFWSVACALAKGEEWAQFEHRDLHLGNVCVKGIPFDGRSSDQISAEDVRNGTRLGFTGLETTIIDYTFSRACMDIVVPQNIATLGLSPSKSPSKSSSSPKIPPKSLQSQQQDEDESDIAFLDLSIDPAVFSGDGEEDYQYDMYRFMRSSVHYGEPLVEFSEATAAASLHQQQQLVEQLLASPTRKPTRRRPRRAPARLTKQAAAYAWRKYTPLTNLVWLHFVLFKLLEGVDAWPSKRRSKALDADGICLQEKAVELESKLRTLEEMLRLEGMKEDAEVAAAADLVGWAVERGWLLEEDVLVA